MSQDTLCTVQLYSIKQVARHGLSVTGYIVYSTVVQHQTAGQAWPECPRIHCVQISCTALDSRQSWPEFHRIYCVQHSSTVHCTASECHRIHCVQSSCTLFTVQPQSVTEYIVYSPVVSTRQQQVRYDLEVMVYCTVYKNQVKPCQQPLLQLY